MPVGADVPERGENVKRKWIRCSLFLILLGVLAEGAAAGRGNFQRRETQTKAATGKNVATLSQLEQALLSREDLTVHLKNDIVVSRTLVVRGRKQLDGEGKYRLRRKASHGSFKGTLLQVKGTLLQLTHITVSGSGKSGGIAGDITGKLVEVDQGTLVIGEGAVLTANYNLSSYTDGGGGVTVHREGVCILESGGVVKDNLTMTGGSAIRVEEGASFVMQGGSLKDNAVVGQKDDSGFDGRGGAVHNRGTAVLSGGVISENAARGVKGTQSGYGGGIYNMGQLRIQGCAIRDNEASFAGGGIYTTGSGDVTFLEGRITGNRSPGGRGGGIYISSDSHVKITGGEIVKNQAEDGSQIFLGSVCTGGMILRNGTVQGGGEAVFCNGGTCEFRGGTIMGTGYGVYHQGGDVRMSGSPRINTMFLGDGCVIRVDGTVSGEAPCELTPRIYEQGKKLVDVSSGEEPEKVLSFFSLRKRGHYVLEAGHQGIYLQKERYRIRFEANGGSGKMNKQEILVGKREPLDSCTYWRAGYGFVGWSAEPVDSVKKESIQYRERESVRNLAEHGEEICLYALWIRRPEIACREEALVFYEEEDIPEEALFWGLTAVDELDGELTEQIEVGRIYCPNGEGGETRILTDASHLGEGEILYRVTNSFGITGEYVRKYEVQLNQAPKLVSCDRYYFTGEYTVQNADAGKEDILRTVRCTDDTDSMEELSEGLAVNWGEIDFERAGEYPVEIQVRDQFGNRFYMPPGEKKQYGRGKEGMAHFVVHIVDPVNDGTGQDEGYVRFVRPEEEKNRAEEVWEISGDAKREIRKFGRSREDPFSKETNDLFLQKFSYLRREDEDG